jgi:hypothetical protein
MNTRLATLLLFALPMMGNQLTVSNPGGQMVLFANGRTAGVGQDFWVNPDGSVLWLSGTDDQNGSWGFQSNTALPLPTGAIVESGMISFSNVVPVVGGGSGEGVATVTLTNAWAAANGCQDGQVFSSTPYAPAYPNGGSFQLNTCPTMDNVQVEFSGLADLRYQQAPIPTVPGFYSQDAFLYTGVPYTITVDYSMPDPPSDPPAADSSAATPEASAIWLLGFGVAGVLAIKRALGHECGPARSR